MAFVECHEQSVLDVKGRHKETFRGISLKKSMSFAYES